MIDNTFFILFDQSKWIADPKVRKSRNLVKKGATGDVLASFVGLG